MATLTDTQRARQEQLETEFAQLRADGAPEQLLSAYAGAPELAREAWARQQADEQQDPAVRKQAKETVRVEADQAGRLADLREQRADRERALEPIEMAAIEAAAADAEQRLPALREKCDQLAPEAVVDAAVRDAWRAAAMEVRRTEEAIELLPAARQELQRRAKARAKVERERLPHVAEAERLMAESLKLAAKVDKELATAFKSLREIDGLNTQLEVALRRAGRDGMAARFKRWQIESAIQYAAMTAGMPRGSMQLESFSGAMALSLARARPLLEVTPQPIHPNVS